MIRRLAAVGLLSIASIVFAMRFEPPVGADDLVGALEAIQAEAYVAPDPIEPDVTTTSSATTTTTTTIPLPPGVRYYDSPFWIFPRGVLQLRVTLEYGVMVDVEMIRVPASSKRATETSLAAGVVLREQALEVQNYKLDIVSGATETSLMYMFALRDVLREADVCVDPKCDMPLR